MILQNNVKYLLRGWKTSVSMARINNYRIKMITKWKNRVDFYSDLKHSKMGQTWQNACVL